MLAFPKKPRSAISPAGTIRVWQSRDRQYRITRLESPGSPNLACRAAKIVVNEVGVRDVWLPLRQSRWRFRTLRAALKEVARFDG